MRAGVSVIRGVHGGGGVGELEEDGEAALNADGDGVLRGVAAGFDDDFGALTSEFGADDAGPKVEGLGGEADVRGIRQNKANSAEMEAMGILAEPIENGPLAST